MFLSVGYADVVNTPAAGDMAFTVSGTERVRIDGDTGYVGVGTTSPGASLTVVGAVTANTFTGDGSGLTNTSSTDGRLVAVIEDQKADATHGGTFSAGAWRIRDLNTETFDPDGVISISSNTFTTTVDGWVEWNATAYDVSEHQTRLYNVTDGATAGVGVSSRENDNSIGGAPVYAGKVYRLEHRAEATNTSDGYGDANTSFGGTNVFSRVKLYYFELCDAGWHKYNGRCYYLSPSDATQSAARTACQGMSADLARIDNAAENDFVHSLVSAAGSRHWIGGTDSVAEGVWRWVDNNAQFWSGDENGYAITGVFTNWRSGSEPNESGGGEDCMDMRESDGRWNDRGCTSSIAYVCEKAL